MPRRPDGATCGLLAALALLCASAPAARAQPQSPPVQPKSPAPSDREPFEQPLKDPPGLLSPQAGDDEVRRMRIELHNTLLRAIAKDIEVLNTGAIGPTAFEPFLNESIDSAKKLRAVRLDLAGTPAERVRAAQDTVTMLTAFETAVESRVAGGVSTPQSGLRFKAARLDAAIRLAEEQRAAATAATPPPGGAPAGVPAVIVYPPARERCPAAPPAPVFGPFRER